MFNTGIFNDRKRSLFVFLNLCLLPVVLFLAVFNLVNQEMHDFYIDLFLILVLVLSVFSILVLKSDMVVYRCALLVWVLALLYAIAIGSGYGSTLYWMLAVPVALIFFFGNKEGLLWVGLFFISSTLMVCYPDFLGTFSYEFHHRVGSVGAFLLITAMVFAIELNRCRFSHLLEREKEALAFEKENLQKALDEIKTLGGMLPICSHCKKIRDDKGYWQQVETYLHEHSDAEFTHALCPECAERFYGDEYQAGKDKE